jgi:hypothetical protein
MGLISHVHRGAHATGLLLVTPLFAVVARRAVFVAAAFAIPLVGLLGLASARFSLPPARDRRVIAASRDVDPKRT